MNGSSADNGHSQPLPVLLRFLLSESAFCIFSSAPLLTLVVPCDPVSTAAAHSPPYMPRLVVYNIITVRTNPFSTAVHVSPISSVERQTKEFLEASSFDDDFAA